MECNAICVGLGQFTSNILVVFALCMIPIVIVVGIMRGIANAAEERDLHRKMKQHQKTELSYYTMPMSDLSDEIERIKNEEPWRTMGWDPASIARYERRQFGNHPDAKLFPDAVKKLAEMESCRSTIAFIKKERSRTPSKWYETRISELENEFANARARARRVAAMRAILLKILQALRLA